MSLRQKFLVLLTLLAVTVSVNAGAALWSIVHFQRAVVGPLASVQQVLQGLRVVKRSLGEQHNFIVSLSPGEPVAPIGARENASQIADDLSLDAITQRMRRLESLANDRLASLEQDVPAYELLAGTGTATNIRQRVRGAHASVDRWLDSFTPVAGDPSRVQPTVSPTPTLDALYQLHELIERTEGQVLDSAGVAMDFSKVLQRSMIFILATSVLAVATAGFLAIRLVRRWVLLPVSQLRIAATRIGKGDFDHRVPVVGTGEIASLKSQLEEASHRPQEPAPQSTDSDEAKAQTGAHLALRRARLAAVRTVHQKRQKQIEIAIGKLKERQIECERVLKQRSDVERARKELRTKRRQADQLINRNKGVVVD